MKRVTSVALGLFVLIGPLATSPLAQGAGDPPDAPEKRHRGAAVSSSASPDSTAADSSQAGSDSTLVVRLAPPYRPSPVFVALRDFRLERSVGVERTTWGEADDPITPPGVGTLDDALRLEPDVRTRELSQGPTAESFEIGGSGSDRAELLTSGRSLRLPDTSGPHTNDVFLSEVRGLSLVRGGASALFGPNAVGGALALDTGVSIPEIATVRLTPEEGTDDLLRAAFQFSRRFGRNAAAAMQVETRTFEGFFPGTKESDRFVSAASVFRLPRDLEGSVRWRHTRTDGRHGGFEPALVRSVLADRDELRFEAFRPLGESRGALAELGWLSETIDHGIGGDAPEKRSYSTPSLRVTADLPSVGGAALVGRAEAERWRVSYESTGEVRTTWLAATSLRATKGEAGRRSTATARVDWDHHRAPAWQGRLEGEWSLGRAIAYGIAAHGERRPDERAALPGTNERHVDGRVGLRYRGSAGVLDLAGYGRRIRNLRRDPTFEEIRAHLPVLDAPVGEAEISGATLTATGVPWTLPAGLGRLGLTSSVGWLRADNTTTDTRLPGRPTFTWTGDGFVERRFFTDELLLRLRGRLSHWHDRVDGTGASVEDLWLTDVLVEGEIGDVVFYLRFHDLLERADEVEPGIRFPGYSRMYGLTWRFRG
ncbi:MAG: TonB-dependent receptor [bacterium]